MIDSLLTLTKRGAFWMAVFFAVVVLLDIGVSAIIGQQEPLFILFAAAILGIFLVTGTYTLAKKLLGFIKRGSERAPKA
jgi:hypothetical protein